MFQKSIATYGRHASLRDFCKIVLIQEAFKSLVNYSHLPSSIEISDYKIRIVANGHFTNRLDCGSFRGVAGYFGFSRGRYDVSDAVVIFLFCPFPSTTKAPFLIRFWRCLSPMPRYCSAILKLTAVLPSSRVASLLGFAQSCFEWASDSEIWMAVDFAFRSGCSFPLLSKWRSTAGVAGLDEVRTWV